MKKKLHTLLGLFLLSSVHFAYGQCTGNRYHQVIFPSVDSTMNVQYGSNFKQDGTTSIDLFFDIYYPSGDADQNRPLVLLAHGGSFISGNKTDLAAVCRYFASMGYVAATMQYRLLAVTPPVMSNPGPEFQKEVVRAMHDMRAAIRFFRKSVAVNGNPYGINPGLIIVGGYSAGGVLADQVAYLNKTAEIPVGLEAYVAAQGGMEGNSGNSGYSSVPQMVLSMCGAISDTVWIEPGDQPVVGVHNVGDQVVPNMKGQPNIGIVVPVTLYGDSLIYARTINVGVNSDYMSVAGNGHCDFPANYIDFVTNFMYNQICVQGLSIKENPNTVTFSVYPNPSENFFYIDVPANQWEWNVAIVNLLGQTVYNQNMGKSQNRIKISSSSFESGIYTIRIKSDDGKIAQKKLVVR